MLDPTFVLIAADKLHCKPERVFGLACEWYEEPHNARWVIDQYNSWYYENTLKGIFLDFVIEVLANRVAKPL